MAVDAHIEELSGKHRALDKLIQEESAKPSSDDIKIAELKRQKLLLNELQFSSEHTGGAFFCLADGSVQFLREEMDFTVYQDMATKDGGEVSQVGP